MPKSDLDLPGREYALVADRITLFYQAFPSGRIITELVSRTADEVTFRALVYRGADEPHPAATGWASEREGDGPVNAVACLENTETSAIGRALANLGFLASTRRPSAEEMAKADATRRRMAERSVARAESGSGGRTTRAAPGAGLAVVRGRAAPSGEAVVSPRQQHADLVADLLALLRDAERAGIRAARAEAIRHALLHTPLAADTLRRVEDGLRAFLARRTAERLAIARGTAPRDRGRLSTSPRTPANAAGTGSLPPAAVPAGPAAPLPASRRRVAEPELSWGGVSSAAGANEASPRRRRDAPVDAPREEERQDGAADAKPAH